MRRRRFYRAEEASMRITLSVLESEVAAARQTVTQGEAAAAILRRPLQSPPSS